jgi:cytochrome c oxidase cbb3-type subunit 3
MGPSLRDSTWLYGGSDADIYASIAEGRANGMPAWGTKLAADQIWQLVSYIQSLRTPNEPERPPYSSSRSPLARAMVHGMMPPPMR